MTPTAIRTVLLAVALLGGLISAYLLRWTCDDAFLSYRCAENLVDGNGLVFNAGERVECYSNFAWTLWIAAGLALGLDAEAWSIGSGLACFGFVVLLLARGSAAVRGAVHPGVAVLPVAALLAAAHEELRTFATGGLETAAFTCMGLLGFGALVWSRLPAGRPALAGLCFGAAALTRPEGALFGGLAGLFVLVTAGVRPALRLGAGLAALLVPFLIWRVSYYGDLFPNTYYAKSAHLPWWDQGWHYVVLYFEKYGAFATAPLLATSAAVWLRGRGVMARPALRQAGLAGLFAVGYTLYVTRVGGDFMFGRFLVPVTPYYLILLELAILAGWSRAGRRAPLGAVATTAAVAAAFVLMPKPVDKDNWSHGITDERAFYDPGRVDDARRTAAALRPLVDGLPVRIAFWGAEARTVYYSGVFAGVDATTGLTDREMARKPIEQRGRPGHEKPATCAELLERRTHLTFVAGMRREMFFHRWLPACYLTIDGVKLRILHWDAPLIAELVRRGAVVDDVRDQIDDAIRKLESAHPGWITRQWDRFERFYFAYNEDPARRAPFEEWLAENPRTGYRWQRTASPGR